MPGEVLYLMRRELAHSAHGRATVCFSSPELAKPAISEVHLHLAAKQPLRSDGEHVAALLLVDRPPLDRSGATGPEAY